MSYRGKGHDPNQRAPQLSPGHHRVRLRKIVPHQDKKTEEPGFLCVLADAKDNECTPWVPLDIDPTTNKDKAWLFWRLVGAFDWPSEAYWKTPPGQREEFEWDTLDVLKEVLATGSEAMVRVESFNDRASVKEMWSPRRDGERKENAPKLTTDADIPF